MEVGGDSVNLIIRLLVFCLSLYYLTWKASVLDELVKLLSLLPKEYVFLDSVTLNFLFQFWYTSQTLFAAFSEKHLRVQLFVVCGAWPGDIHAIQNVWHGICHYCQLHHRGYG